LRHNQTAVAAVEFALVAPPFLIMLMGGFDLGHTLYTQAILNGEVLKAARGSSLEAGSAAAQQTIIDNTVRNAVLNMNKNATVTITRKFYDSFTGARIHYEDVNQDGICSSGEKWMDLNGNGSFDDMRYSTGQGGAKDAVRYTVTMSYPRIFPVATLIGLSPNVSLSATTVYANQPYGEQAVRTGTTTLRNCP
ncbi:MAG: TadE family protein, partial [Sphingobium sp.]